jgi:hypothetical protein
MMFQHVSSAFPVIGLISRLRSRGRAAGRRRLRRCAQLSVECLEGRKLLSTASASNGQFSVFVFSRTITSTDVDLFARVSRNGFTVRDNIPVATSSRVEDVPAVSINQNGRFAVAWEDRLSSSDTDIKLRVFNGSGFALTSAMTVDTSTKREFDPAVSLNDFGRIVVSYTQTFSSTDLDVRAKQYFPSSSTGTSYTTTSFAIATEANRNEFDSSVLVAPNGDWAVSYTRRFSSTDLDAKVFVHRTSGTTVTKTVAASSSNEENSIIESFAGGSSITVSYLINGFRRRTTLSV